MPYDDPDATDPMTLHGVGVETDDPEAIREMAACFVEEFVRLGLGADRIFELFTHGSFAGPSMALRALGPEAISNLIQDEFRRRGSRAGRVAVDRTAGGLSLPVLEPQE